MVEGNITNQYPLTKIRNYYRMGDGILDGYPIIQDQTSPNLAHIPTTNILTYSEDFDTYRVAASTVTPNSTTAPDGTNSGILVTQGVSTLVLRANNVVAPSTTYTFSGYFKSSSSVTQVILDITDNANTTFDLTNKWQRFSVTAESRADGSPYHFVDVATNGSQGDTFYAWGLQVEEQTQATAYIKSDGIAAVRKATTTNLIPYSEDTSQSSWTDNHITWSHNLYPSPIGTNNATKITSTNNGAKVVVSLNLENSKAYTVSMYIKNISTTSVKMLVYQNNDAAIPLNSNYQDELSTTEWVRVEKTFTTTSTATGGTVQIQPARDIPNNEEMYIWGLQVEEQTQAETYAKTTGLPVTIDLFTENNYGTMTNMSASDIVPDTPNN
jgi:hypothetical protein